MYSRPAVFRSELPALSLSESYVKPTTMLYRNMLAMEVEELLRSHPVDGAVLMGGCDKTTPGLVMGAVSAGLPMIYLPAGPMLRGNYRGKAWVPVRMPGNSGMNGGRAICRPMNGSRWKRGIARSYGTLHDHGHGKHYDGDCRSLGLDVAGRELDSGR